MVNFTLRRYTKEYNFILAKKYICGKRQNMFFSIRATAFKYQIAAAGHEFSLKHKLQFSEHLIKNFGFRHGYKIKYICENKILLISLKKTAGIRQIDRVINSVCDFVEPLMVPQNSCFICTQPCSNEVVIDGHIVALAHDYCVDNMLRRLAHNTNIRNTTGGGYDKGAFAALTGALTGGMLWVAMHSMFQYSWLLAAFPSLCARDAYYLLKCRLGRKSKGIILGMSAFAFAASVLYIQFFGLKEHGLPVNMVNVYKLLIDDPEYIKETLKLVLCGGAAAFVGMIPVIIDNFEHKHASHKVEKRVPRAV